MEYHPALGALRRRRQARHCGREIPGRIWPGQRLVFPVEQTVLMLHEEGVNSATLALSDQLVAGRHNIGFAT